MTNKFLSFLLLSAAAFTLSASDAFYAAGPRESINLAGSDWQATTADSIDISKVPNLQNWKPETVPTLERSILPKSKNSWGYPPERPVEFYLEKDQKTFKIKKNLSAWYRKTVEIPADALKNHTAHLVFGAVAFRSAFRINGKLVGESIQSTLNRDIDITKYLHPGKNEILIAFTGREGLVDIPGKTYLAPSAGIGSGIHLYARIDFRPLTAIGDVFVKPNVKRSEIEFDLTLVNRGKKSSTVTPRVVIRSNQDEKEVYTAISGKPVTIAPETTVRTTVKGRWKAPVLWDLHSPVLYNADVQLFADQKLEDTYRQRFGVREFEIRGRDFFLNGRHITLLRGSTLSGINGQEYVPIWDGMGKLNSNRLHLGFNNMQYVRIGDEQGYLIIPESGWWHVDQYPHETASVWLPGTLEYYKGWIKQLRNHPSVVIWSLANETYWNRVGKEEMDLAKQIIAAVRSMDDTRPLQGDSEITWNNQLDIVNIHYPEWNAGEINLKYPNAGMNMPNDTWYLRKGKDIVSWRAKFDWDRPLVIGEYFCNDDAQDENFSSFMGDSVFNGEKWRKQRLTGMGEQNSEDFIDNLFVETLKKYTTEYRAIGVAGMNIWTGEKDRFMPKQLVRPYDFHPNGDAGKLFSRKIVLLNDDRLPLKLVRAKLIYQNAVVWEQEFPVHVNSGERKEMTLSIPLPNVTQPAQAQLLVTLFTIQNPHYLPREVSRFDETVYLVPEIRLPVLRSQIAILGKTPAADALLKKIGIENAPEKISGNTKTVIVPADAYRTNMAAELTKFAENGGVVLILPQKDWRPFRLELPERDLEHAATQAWVRTPSHPVLKQMKAGQFSFWKPNNIVSIGTFKKPLDGAFELPLDCGGKYGLRWTPLLEVPIGKGAILLTTFELEKASVEEPAAKQLFANLLEYGCHRPAKIGTPLNLLNGTNSLLDDALALTGAEIKKGIGIEGPVLVDSSAKLGAKEIADLKQALNDGRTVWMHNFTPETIGQGASLLPFRAEWKKKPSGVEGAILCSDDPLTHGLANFDFFWYRGSSTKPSSLKVIAKTGDWTLDSPWNGLAERLTSPAFLTKIKVGKGTILFDTLPWERATASETDKALRIASLLIKNSGGSFVSKTNLRYNRFFVDLSKAANMGYHDRVADDGKGGWTDQGKNDMRLFLINHTGKMNAADDGMDVSVPAFPEKVDFNKIIYSLTDPKSNNGKAVISLGSDRNGSKLMRSMSPVAVNQKADILWFLHSAGWVPGTPGTPIAEYTVAYEDGSTVKIPIRAHMEVGDWHTPKMLGAASVAWTGPNLFTGRVGLWTFPWKNPFPEKTIKSISLRGGLSDAQYVLVAITGGVRQEGGDSETVAAEWDFANRKYANKLYPSAKAPVETKDGVQFGTQQFYTAQLKNTPVPDVMKKPYGVLADFTITAKPDGYMSGVVQMCQYMKSGFRMVIHKNLKINVEIFVDGSKKAFYIASKNPVPLNRRTTAEIRFDGQKAILLVNGKIDTIISCPFPQIHQGEIQFGNASGPKYHFNGILHGVKIKTAE